MRIALYNPYLNDIIGGGERHFLSIAECLSKKNQVDVVLSNKPDSKFISNLESTFNLDLSKVNFITGPFNDHSSWLDRYKFSKLYDIFYLMTDGSVFISGAKKNIVHLQIPLTKKPPLIQKLKLKSWHTLTVNSLFTKKWLENHLKINIDYIHRGSIDTKNLKPTKKTNTIISVGRFISGKDGKHCKRQDFLVKTFKKMVSLGLKNWQLVLVGPIEKGNDNKKFAGKVKMLAKNLPVKLYHHAGFNDLVKLYGQAKIYWHATGYGQNQTKNPQAVEHLGLTTAEAQSAGAVPVVINKGGQPEVVTHALNGILWDIQKQLIDNTFELIKTPTLLHKLAKKAIQNSNNFSKLKFCRLTQKIFTL